MKIRKILAIMLIITIILGIITVPKVVHAEDGSYTITYNATFGEFSNGTKTNVVTYNSNHEVISGTYEEPIYDTGVDSSDFIAWYEEYEAENRVRINEVTQNKTVYAAYEKVVLLRQDYTGQEETFNSPIDRYLQYELWGAQGGESVNTTYRGLGGYSSGFVKNSIIYINIGEQGKKGIYNAYNGGGSPSTANGGSGGGATHIATASGVLSTLSDNKEAVMIVAGGGGGAGQMTTPITTITGSGGGFKGANGGGPMYYGTGGTQTAGGTANGVSSYYKNRKATFGLGGNGEDGSGAYANAGGGGGYYGGGGTGWAHFTNKVGIAGGGSGYIGNEKTYDGIMYGYNVPTSDEVKTLTYSTTNYSDEAITGYAKEGNGYVQANLIRVWATFNWNDGDEQEPKEKKYEMYPNEVVPPEVTPRTGYRFEWRKVGEDVAYDFTIPVTRDTEFIGVWIPIVYDIETDNNGGELEEGKTNPKEYTIESEDITLNNPISSEEGYEFEGWSEDDGTTKNINVTIPTGSIGDRSFKAYYKAIEYLIEYVLDGGTATGNPDKYTIESDDITLNNPTKEGYTFNGWTGTDLDTETLDVTIANGSTGNRTFTANWGINEYMALFYSNGGTTANPEYILKNYNEELGELPTTSKEGYRFDGWYTARTGGTQISSTTTMPAGDITYYAHWTPIEYTITFNSNTGTGSMRPQTHTYDEEKTLSENTFEKTGYTFIGWSTKEDGTGTNYTDKQSIKNLSTTDGDNINLYAQWRTTKYSITYDLGEGGLEEGKINPIEYTIESDNITLNNPVPTKESYEFIGWSGTDLTGDENTVVTIPTGSTGNRTYTANYTPIEYTIEYDLGIGSLVTSNPTTYNVETSTFTLNNPTSPDVYHYFVGWTTDKETEEDLSENYKIEKGTTGNIKLYAVFQTNPYTVTFVSDGEKVDEYVRRGAEPVGTLPTVDEKEYYGFMGWYVNGKKIDENFISRDDCTVVALWEYTHVHNLTLVPAKEPNCVEKGNKAYYVCSECGKWFEDATGLVEITDKTSVEIPIDPEAHDWGDWVIVKQPTTTEKGLKQRICKNDSSHIETEEIPTIVYEITGGDTEHEIGSGKDITTTTNGDIDELKEVRVDGKVVDPSNYTVDAETKTVTLKSSFLDTLAEGKHTLTLVFTNGEVSRDFWITKAQSTETKQETKSSNPLTGDDITKWTVTLAIATAMLYITSKKTKRLRRAKVKGKRFK